MKSIKIRVKQIQDITLVRMLIRHPMETGRRIEKENGEIIPAHYINKLIIHHEDKLVAACNLGPGISMDPYFSFRFKNGKPGDLITITWTDNQGFSDSASTKLK